MPSRVPRSFPSCGAWVPLSTPAACLNCLSPMLMRSPLARERRADSPPQDSARGGRTDTGGNGRTSFTLRARVDGALVSGKGQDHEAA
jgi:hypothetical protein